MSKYKCVIFDCDGVLVDSEVIGNTVLVEMANEHGANVNLDYALKHFKGNSFRNCVAQIEDLINNKLPEDFEKEFRKRSSVAFKKHIKPVEGITEVVKNLKIPFCVASSGPESKIRLNLELTGLLPYFENNIFSCFTLGKWKPEPDVFLWAAKTLDFQPKECLVVEDSMQGVKAALNGGFDVVGYTAHDYRNVLKSKATFTIKHMNELKDLL